MTGLTSNPSIFDKAIGSGDYDDAIRAKAGQRLSDEDLFFELAIEDLQRAADLFLPIHERTDGVDGWVSLEVSPLLAYDTARTIEAAKSLHARAGPRQPVHQDPGDARGAARHHRGHRRRRPGQRDAAVLGRSVPCGGRGLPAGRGAPRRRRPRPGGRLGGFGVHVSLGRRRGQGGAGGPGRHSSALAVGLDVYRAYRQAHGLGPLPGAGERRRPHATPAVGQHQSTKDPTASDTLYVHGLAAPFTVNTMPDETLEAFYDHGEVGEPMPADGGNVDARLGRFRRRRGRTGQRWRPNSRATARRRSSTRGTSSSAGSRREVCTRLDCASPPARPRRKEKPSAEMHRCR